MNNDGKDHPILNEVKREDTASGFKNSDYIELIMRVIDYADQFGETGVTRTRALLYIFTSYTHFKKYLQMMLDAGLVILVPADAGPKERQRIVATEKGRKYVKLVKRLLKMCTFPTRPARKR